MTPVIYALPSDSSLMTGVKQKVRIERNQCRMKKIGNIFLDILIVLVVVAALTISVMVITSKATGVANVFGYSPVSVLTDSMEPTFNTGDLIIIKQIDTDNLKKDDIVTYKEVINEVEVLNTHRIIERYVEPNGFINYVTQGDNVPQRDIMPIYPDQIVGQYIDIKIPYLGKAIDFVKTQNGILICFVIPLALLFIWQLYKFIMLLAESRKEKEIEAVTSSLEEEKKKLSKNIKHSKKHRKKRRKQQK